MIDSKPTTAADARLIGRALRQRWPISDDYCDLMIKGLMRKIADKESTGRDVAACARVLLLAQQQNIDADDDDAEQDRNRFLAIAKERGIEVSIERLPGDRPDGDPAAADRSDDVQPLYDYLGRIITE